MLFIEIKNKYLYTLLFFLKKHSLTLFTLLIDLICFEIIWCKYKYTILYTLLSLQLNTRLNIKLKVILDFKIKILSVLSLYINSDWAEREIFEFYGVYFFFNKDLRKLLLDYGFKGYPLRKDFPITGYIELYYDDSIKKIIYEHLELSQEYRQFFLNYSV